MSMNYYPRGLHTVIVGNRIGIAESFEERARGRDCGVVGPRPSYGTQLRDRPGAAETKNHGGYCWNEGEKLTSSARSPGDALCALPRQVAPPSSLPQVNHHAASTSSTSAPKVHGIDMPESHWEIDEFCVGDGKIRT